MTRILTILGVVMLVLQLLGTFRYLANEWKLWRRGNGPLMRMILLLIAICAFGSPAWAAEPEERCAELDANCICAESLNATAVTTHASNYAFNPTNSTTKECGGLDGKGAGMAISDTNPAFTTRYTWDSTGEAITNLPAAHDASILNVLRTKSPAEGNAGGGAQYIGHYAATADYLTIFRFYRYLTSDYVWVDATCSNSSKVFEMGALPNLQMYMSSASNPGPMSLNAWIGWTPATIDCCTQGPATDVSYTGNPAPAILDPGPTQASLRGKWWRYEVRSRGNRTTDPAWHLDVYAKNITDNLTEQKIIDTDIVTTDRFGGDQWTAALAASGGVKPSYGDIREFVINTFRRDTCAGSIAMSHVLVAGYTSDTGQRVGAAYEMEGGGSGGASSSGLYVMIMKSIVPISIGLEGILFGSFLISRRASIKQFAVAAKRYCQSLPSPHEMYWIVKYRHAVKRWQKQAPLRLPPPREATKQKEQQPWL